MVFCRPPLRRVWAMVFPLCGGADEAEQAWRIDQGSYLPKVESPGAAAPTTNFGSVSVWVWKRVGSSAELNTFLLLVSPLQCRRHGGEYLAGTASVLYCSDKRSVTH